MYRVCFPGAEPFGHACETLEAARELVRATAGEHEVLPGGDDEFWLCYRNLDDDESEVVARIFGNEASASEAAAPSDPRSIGLNSPSTESERVPHSSEVSTALSEASARLRRAAIGS